ncbi:MAG: bifunctional oligoribonuclease/PAP phosphatase NrnA [Phycisphaerales bacterium]|nr:bifunctional oligoribonuclease/PAP phosphatase NrnA [Planctomycetota bacterium]
MTSGHGSGSGASHAPRSAAKDKWGSTTDLPSIAQWLRTKTKVVVVTHVKPDGDAVGSSIALTRALNLSGASAGTAVSLPSRARAWYFGPRPSWIRRVVGDTPSLSIENASEIEHEHADAVVIVDTGSWVQVEMVKPWLAQHTADTAVIDHHAQGDPDIAPRRVVDTTSAAAAQIVAELCRILLNKKSLADLPREVAEPLYLGLATDTGWFKHSNVTPAVLRVASELLAAGVDHAALYVNIEQRERLPRLKLLGRALDSLKLFDENRVAIMSITKADFASTGAQPADSGGFADHSQTLETVMVTAVLTEADAAEFGMQSKPGEKLTKISLRSKSVAGSVDVNAVAKEFGGGGHVRAAGAKVALGLDETKTRLLDAIRRHWGT